MLHQYFHLLQEIGINHLYLSQNFQAEESFEHENIQEIQEISQPIALKSDPVLPIIKEIIVENTEIINQISHKIFYNISDIQLFDNHSFNLFQLKNGQKIIENIDSLNRLDALAIIAKPKKSENQNIQNIYKTSYQMYDLLVQQELSERQIHFLEIDHNPEILVLDSILQKIIASAKISLVFFDPNLMISHFVNSLQHQEKIFLQDFMSAIFSNRKSINQLNPAKIMSISEFKAKSFSQEEKLEYWQESLNPAILQCQKCNLRKNCNKPVVGMGDINAKIVFVGEAPGEEEDLNGLPFIGQSGKLLDSMMASIGLSREKDIYITNVVKCRPPNNRDPEPKEVEECQSYLKQQLLLIQPKLIIAVGKVSGEYLFNRKIAYKLDRLKLHSYEGIPLAITYHPSYLLRSPSEKIKSWEDFSFFKSVINNLV